MINRLIIILMLVLVSCNLYMDYTFIKVGWCESEIQVVRDQVYEMYNIIIK